MKRAVSAARNDAFADFVRLQSATLLRTGYLLTRDRVEAEELVQDTLVALYPRWDQVEAAEHQLAYVRKSMVNRFLAGRRRKSAGEVYLADAPGFVDPPSAGGDGTVGVDDRDLLWRAMAGLTDRQRAALVLRFFHDLPDREVAGLLDCETGTVRSLISRGLAVLRGTGMFDAHGADDAGDADDAGGADDAGDFYLRDVR